MKKIGLAIALIGLATVNLSDVNKTELLKNIPTVESVPMMFLGTEPLIGGGLHDIINTQSIYTLERWALTTEAHHTKISGKKILGGLHGRKEPLTKQDYISFIFKMTELHPELNNANKLDELSISYGITTKSSEIFEGGLVDYIFRTDFDIVKRWALTAEAHHIQVTGMPIIGGIHGRLIEPTKEQYAQYVLDMANIHPELNNSAELDRLSLVYNISSPSLLQFGGLHDYLQKQDRQTLEKWALTVEAHHKKITGSEIVGGIHGRQNPLTKQEFMQYITDMLNIYPELNSASKLDQLSVTYGINNTSVLNMGGLHDFIFRESHENLERWALTVEAHHIKVTGKPIIGGIHGRREPLTNEEYANYILDMVKIYPGLNSRNELDRLSIAYGISKPNIKEGRGGLHDYIFRQDRDTLIRWALTAEAHYKQKTGLNIRGGIHGRKDPLTDEEYAKYVIDMAEKFPELDNAAELDRLSQVYGLSDNPSLQNMRGRGGLHDYIFRKDRKTLIRWALTCEAHDRQIKNVVLVGGLHDYIEKLTNEEIADYILRMAENYTVLNSEQGLESFAKKYSIQQDSLKFLN